MINKTISNKAVAYNGALVAFAGVLVYSLAVMLYAIIRSTVSIIDIMPRSEQNKILWISGFSMAYCVVVFSLLMAIVSLPAGALTGVILRKMFLSLNPSLETKKAVAISSITALILLSLLYLLLYTLLKERITIQYFETFLFWYIFPAILFFVVVVAGGLHLNKYLMS